LLETVKVKAEFIFVCLSRAQYIFVQCWQSDITKEENCKKLTDNIKMYSMLICCIGTESTTANVLRIIWQKWTSYLL